MTGFGKSLTNGEVIVWYIFKSFNECVSSNRIWGK